MVEVKKGSILMEFVIVLPIYFLLIGFAFVMGELALHSIQLAGSADRSLALSTAAFDAFEKAAAPSGDPSATEDYSGDGGGKERISEYHTRKIEWSWNESFEGPWSKVVAATVSDDYTLTPLTRGFVAFWYRDSRRKVEDMGGEDLKDSALDEMIKDSGVVGRLTNGMTGRDRDQTDVRGFGYYTLVRNRMSTSGGYRSWEAGALVNDDKWRKYVADEGFLETDPENPDSNSDLRGLTDSSSFKDPPTIEKGNPIYIDVEKYKELNDYLERVKLP